jgi:Kef-type K+ transport system membrane component KefB
LLLGGALVVVGILGKLVAGFAPWWFRGDRLMVGIGMVPRGEVGLIFAQMGLAAGAVTSGQYGALMIMVLGTTFVTPPALAWRARHHGAIAPDSDDRPGSGGIDDLVAGTALRSSEARSTQSGP